MCNDDEFSATEVKLIEANRSPRKYGTTFLVGMKDVLEFYPDLLGFIPAG